MSFATGIYTGLICGAVLGFAAALLLDLQCVRNAAAIRRGEREMRATRRTP